MESREGQCLCGGVRYRLEVPVDHIGACHCQMCRRFSGGIELGIDIPEESVTWLKDDTLRVYSSSEWAERGFCGTCGSSLFYRLKSGGFFSLSAGTLDDISGLPLTTEVYIDHKPAGYAFANETTKMTEADIMAMVAAQSEGESK